jgi:hypothetical protein
VALSAVDNGATAAKRSDTAVVLSRFAVELAGSVTRTDSASPATGAALQPEAAVDAAVEAVAESMAAVVAVSGRACPAAGKLTPATATGAIGTSAGWGPRRLFATSCDTLVPITTPAAAIRAAM